MSEEVKPDKIKKTQESLLKFIKKPPLTDKLLKKPPFRFLHDIVTSVMRETGFLNGVYSPEELNSENIKDRDGKINFLDKLISNIKSLTGTTISAKPSKIIAGLEVNKTLDLLIALAKAADIKVNGSKGTEKNPSKTESKDSKKTSRSNKDDKADAAKKKRDESKSREKDVKKKPESKQKVAEKSKTESAKTNTKVDKGDKQNNNTTEEHQVVELNESPQQNGERVEVNGEQVKEVESIGSPVKRPSSKRERPPSRDAKHSAKDSKSAERRSSSKRSSSDIASSEPKPEDKSSSSVEENRVAEPGVKQEDLERKAKLPDKVPLEQIVQNSSDSVSNSHVSSDPSDKINGNTSPEINGDLSSLEGSERPERKARISSVNSRMERYLSAKNEAKNDNSKQHLEKVEESKPKPEEPPKTAKMKRPQSAKMRPGSSRQRKVEEKAESEEKGQVVLGQGGSGDVMGAAPISAPSAKGRRMLSGRPMSSRPGAPKPKDRGQVNPPPEPSSNNEEVKPIALIEDNNDNDDDAENLVTVENEPLTNEPDKGMEEEIHSNLDESNQGALVSQILETKKELEDTKKWQTSYQQRTTVEIDWDAKTKSRRDVVAKEVRSLRDGIQALTRAANPLGKLFDFLQEDVELMQSELEEWARTNTKLQSDIQLQSKQTDELLLPLRKQLADLDLLIEHEEESIRRVKSNIHLNTNKLETLLKINNT